MFRTNQDGTTSDVCSKCGEVIEGVSVNTPTRECGGAVLGLEHYHPFCAGRVIYEMRYPERLYEHLVVEGQWRESEGRGKKLNAEEQLAADLNL